MDRGHYHNDEDESAGYSEFFYLSQPRLRQCVPSCHKTYDETISVWLSLASFPTGLAGCLRFRRDVSVYQVKSQRGKSEEGRRGRGIPSALPIDCIATPHNWWESYKVSPPKRKVKDLEIEEGDLSNQL